MNLTSNRRADEFHRLLDAGTRTDDPVDAPMLALVEALQAVPTVEGPRPEFRQALRQRLVAVATVQGVGAPAETPIARARAAGRTWRVQRRLTALAAGAAVVTGVSGVALGATRSLPGDPFYGVKKAAESLQLAATTGTEARGKRHLDFARARLGEVADLARHHDAGAIVSTLHTMDVETRDGANDLLAAYRGSGSLEPLRALDRFTTDQYQRLHALLPTLPPAAQAPARGSLALLTVVASRTVETARTVTGSTGTGGTVVPGPGTTTPGAGRPSSAPSAVVPTTAPRTSPQPAASSPTSSTGTRSSHPPLPVPTSLLPTSHPLPSTLPTPLPLPSLATIPPLPQLTPLPSLVPSLPALLPGLGG